MCGKAGALRALYGQANGTELFLLHMGVLSLFCSFCYIGFVIFFSFCQENGSLHVLATCIKSLHILILLHANHYSKLLISHCMQLVSYLFVLLAYYYIPYAFGATTKFALKCVSLLLNLFINGIQLF